MRIATRICAAALAVFFAGDAFAFDAAAPDGTSPTSAKHGSASEDAGARSAKSIECSQKADAQDLHGKPRKRFMHECKRGA
jgi:psiF repeat